MAHDDFFDLSLEEQFDSFDPLADVADADFDEEAPIESGAMRPEPSEFLNAEQLAAETARLAEEPPAIRIATLLDHMKPFRKTLLQTLAFCSGEARAEEDLLARIDELQATNKSIYSAENLCGMLLRAGALERLTEDGEPYELTETQLEPKTVVIDGVAYLKPVTPPACFWRTTADGDAVVREDRPDVRLRALLETEPQYRHFFRYWLEEASAETGANQKKLSGLIDNDPAALRPRMYSMRFGEKLAEADALVWRNRAWHITDLGREALTWLDELDAKDRAAAAEAAAAEE